MTVPLPPDAESWECAHLPRCADAACSYNPAMQRRISAPVPRPDAETVVARLRTALDHGHSPTDESEK